MSVVITCPLCGEIYYPENQAVCQGCPLQHSCGLVRCPYCGFETPDLRHSTAISLAQWVLKRLSKDAVQSKTVEYSDQ